MWIFRSGLLLLVFTGISIYTGARLHVLFKFLFPSLKSLIYWVLFILFCYAFILAVFVRFEWLRPFRDLAMNSLPALFYLFLAILAFDLTYIVLRFIWKISLPAWFSAAGAGIALFLMILFMIYGTFHARNINRLDYSITLNKGSGNGTSIKAAMVSDLHIGTTVDRKWVGKIVNAINETNPDIIFVAGDIFDNDLSLVKDPEGVIEELSRLKAKAPLGVYACQGNHDVDRISFRGEGSTERIKEFLNKAGINFLLDEVVEHESGFYIAGRRDARPIGRQQERKPIEVLLEGLDRTKPVILLDHQPVDYPKEDEARVDLILSGHTHKGQFFPANIFTKMIFKKAGAVHYGYFKGQYAQGVVSSGVGVWGPPIRVATNSEVVVINILFM